MNNLTNWKHDENAKMLGFASSDYFELEQKGLALKAEKYNRISNIRSRNVSVKRNDHFAQIEITLEYIYENKIVTALGSLSIEEKDVLNLCKSLLGNKYKIVEA